MKRGSTDGGEGGKRRYIVGRTHVNNEGNDTGTYHNNPITDSQKYEVGYSKR